MNNWINTTKNYLNKFIELGVLLLAISVIAEIVFGPDVAFFGSQVTKNLINLLDSLGDQGIAALIIVLAVIFTYRKLLK
jgi:H+/gluconate symporter-like permease